MPSSTPAISHGVDLRTDAISIRQLGIEGFRLIKIDEPLTEKGGGERRYLTKDGELLFGFRLDTISNPHLTSELFPGTMLETLDAIGRMANVFTKEVPQSVTIMETFSSANQVRLVPVIIGKKAFDRDQALITQLGSTGDSVQLAQKDLKLAVLNELGQMLTAMETCKRGSPELYNVHQQIAKLYDEVLEGI